MPPIHAGADAGTGMEASGASVTADPPPRSTPAAGGAIGGESGVVGGGAKRRRDGELAGDSGSDAGAGVHAAAGSGAASRDGLMPLLSVFLPEAAPPTYVRVRVGGAAQPAVAPAREDEIGPSGPPCGITSRGNGSDSDTHHGPELRPGTGPSWCPPRCAEILIALSEVDVAAGDEWKAVHAVVSAHPHVLPFAFEVLSLVRCAAAAARGDPATTTRMRLQSVCVLACAAEASDGELR